MIFMKKTTLRAGKPDRQTWHLADGEGKVVGRLAARISVLLMGKHRPDYTPFINNGDYVVLVNCEKVVFTGNKWRDKTYRHHSGYIGGLKEATARRVLAGNPDRIMRLAVKRMLPKSKLGEAMLKKLKIYAGPDHPHQAQKLEPMK